MYKTISINQIASNSSTLRIFLPPVTQMYLRASASWDISQAEVWGLSSRISPAKAWGWEEWHPKCWALTGRANLNRGTPCLGLLLTE